MSYRSGGTIRGPLHLDGTVSPGPSGSGSGSIYYDSATNSFRASENGGSFVSLTNPTTGGGWTDGGVSVRLTTQS